MHRALDGLLGQERAFPKGVELTGRKPAPRSADGPGKPGAPEEGAQVVPAPTEPRPAEDGRPAERDPDEHPDLLERVAEVVGDLFDDERDPRT